MCGSDHTFWSDLNYIRYKTLKLIPPPFIVASWFYCHTSHWSCIINAPAWSRCRRPCPLGSASHSLTAQLAVNKPQQCSCFSGSVLVPGLIRFLASASLYLCIAPWRTSGVQKYVPSPSRGPLVIKDVGDAAERALCSDFASDAVCMTYIKTRHPSAC